MKKVLLVWLLALVAACSKDNPYYCESAPDHNCAVTAPDAAASCESNPLICGGATPVCANQSCRACVAHSECASDACLPTGACGTDDEVAFVKPGDSIAAAVATGKPYVKLTGALDEAVVLTNVNVHFLADPGTTLTRSTSGAIIDIHGTSNVAIDDLVIRDGLGNTGHGINIASGESMVSLTLDHVALLDNGGIGVNAGDGKLTMDRCIVSGNKNGGASIAAAMDVANSLFVGNGSSTSIVGGVSLTPRGSGNAFKFNTVADNFSSSGSVSVRGVNCPVPMTVNSTIVTGNAASLNCTFEYSLLAGDPKFKATDATSPLAPDYYRIGPTSDAIDHADNAATMARDIDGQLREGARDIGADEFQ